MQPLFIKELLILFFKQCSNNPQVFVANFNHSDHLIGFNYRCNDGSFTHISDSFKQILGYNHQNVLKNGNFTSKLVHPQDKEIIDDCLRKAFLYSRKTSQHPDFYKFTAVKCRTKHIQGYWKYCIIYAQGYWNQLTDSNDKIGVIVNERTRKDKFKGRRIKDDHNSIYQRNADIIIDNEYVDDLNIISPRENEILILISNGLVTKEIAKQLFISESTVISHRKNLISKFHVHNTAELIKLAARRMLI